MQSHKDVQSAANFRRKNDINNHTKKNTDPSLMQTVEKKILICRPLLGQTIVCCVSSKYNPYVTQLHGPQHTLLVWPVRYRRWGGGYKPGRTRPQRESSAICIQVLFTIEKTPTCETEECNTLKKSCRGFNLFIHFKKRQCALTVLRLFYT